MSSASNDSANAAADWLGSAAHTTYDFFVVLCARSFGEKHAHIAVGGLALAIFGLMTALAAWYVFREVAEIGFKVLRVLLMLGVVAVMISLLGNLFMFVFPSNESRQEARAVAQQATEHVTEATTTYLFGDLWSKVFGGGSR